MSNDLEKVSHSSWDTSIRVCHCYNKRVKIYQMNLFLMQEYFSYNLKSVVYQYSRSLLFYSSIVGNIMWFLYCDCGKRVDLLIFFFFKLTCYLFLIVCNFSFVDIVRVVNLQGRIKERKKQTSELKFDFSIDSIGKQSFGISKTSDETVGSGSQTGGSETISER